MRDWLKELRLASGYTQTDIANYLKISRSYYTQIELGNRNPSPKIAIELGRFLAFDWTRFFES
ncbi:MAG: helix-turn-helix transcriptional regulator [Saccharofermentanales bacterium]|jgi:putative transcriptional regulator